MIPSHCSGCACQVVDAVATRFHRVTGSHKYVTSTCSACGACGGLIHSCRTMQEVQDEAVQK